MTMKLFIRLSMICALSAAAGCSAFFSQSRSSSFDAQNSVLAALGAQAGVSVPGPRSALPPYERLTYQMRWVGIPVGTLTTTVKGIEKINGRDAYVLEAEAHTTGFCSAIYKIDDHFISYMDVEKLYTLRHEVHRREGSHRKDGITDFDQVNHRASHFNQRENTRKEYDIPPDAQDTISASYYFMLLPMKQGDRVESGVWNNERISRLLAFIGGRNTLRLDGKLGEREGFQVEPFAELRGQRVDKGRVSAYYSWDERRIPLFAVIKAPVLTSVTVTLVHIENEPPGEKK